MVMNLKTYNLIKYQLTENTTFPTGLKKMNIRLL